MKSERLLIESMTRRLQREKSARKHAESLLTQKSVELYDALMESKTTHKKFKLALWASQESLWEWNASDDCFSIRAFTPSDDHDVEPKEQKGSAIKVLANIHSDDKLEVQYLWSKVLRGGSESIEATFRYHLIGQGYQWMRLRGRALERNEQGVATRIIGITRDISRERDAEQSFHLMASAFSSSREPMLILSPDLTITECNSAFLDIIAISNRQDCIGQSLKKYLRDERDELSGIPIKKQLRFDSELMVTEYAKPVPVDVSVGVFQEASGESAYLIATLQDISERQENEERLKQLALHDELTGLRNRSGLRESMTKLLNKGESFCVAFMDLDGFKQVNSAAGHDRGDVGLQSVANILRHTFEPGGIVTRWGGDEFVMIIPGLNSQACSQICKEVIQRIEDDVIYVQNTELKMSASIGLASYPSHGSNLETLIQNADAAMFRAKESGRRQVFVYEDGLAENLREQVSMVSDLRRAISNKTLEFYLQGKYNIRGQLKSAELLCRWNSPLHGRVSPDVFIPLAESHQLDMDIGILALENACQYIGLMHEQNIDITLAVNISANQLLSSSFAEQAKSICLAYEINPDWIEMEITESLFIKDETSAFQALSRLRDKGFKIALDDFGSGFSSLGYLRRFEFESVKIDRSLVTDIHCDNKARALLRGIISMLEALQVDVIVEGVETIDYIPILKEMNVTLLQGYLFEKPTPLHEFILTHAKSPLIQQSC